MSFPFDLPSFLQSVANSSLWLQEGEKRISGTQWVEEIERQAALLSPSLGRRLYFPLENTVASLTTFFAYVKAGFLVFVGNPTYPREKLLAILQYVQPHQALLPKYQAPLALDSVQEPSFCGKILCFFEGRPSQIDAQEQFADVAILTSGTTGTPKAVLHRFSSLVFNGILHARSIGLQPREEVGVALPLSFSFGLVALMIGSLSVGACLNFAPSNVPEDLSFWASQISVLNVTPLLLKRLRSVPKKILTIGGDFTSSSLAQSIIDNHPSLSLYTTYGLSEAGPRVSTMPVKVCDTTLPQVPLGYPLDCIEWKVGLEEELLVKTPTVMLGYFNHEEETQKVMTEGFLRTGDLVRVHRDTLLYLGRKKRLIVRGGEKIYPAEVESVCQKFPGVTDAFVTYDGHRLKAYLQTHTPFQTKTLLSFLRAYIPSSHLPEEIECVETLPSEARKK